MRSFTAVRHSNNPAYFYGGLWSGNFYPALQELGHEIVESQVDLLPTSRFMHIKNNFTRQELEVRAQTTEEIIVEVIREHNRKPINLFLSYFYNAHFDPGGFDELRRLGIPSINFYCNSVYQFDCVAAIAKKADFSWHPEKEARQLYLKAGANPVWVQFGADPNLYAPRQCSRRIAKAVFVGARYSDRDRWLAALIRAGVPVDIYGAGWKAASPEQSPVLSPERAASSREYLGRPIVKPGTVLSYLLGARDAIATDGLTKGSVRLLEQWRYGKQTKSLQSICAAHARGFAPDVAELFSKYELSLNFSNVWADGRPGSALVPHVRLRDFEAPMAGASYMTGYSEEITEFYDIGREIECYREQAELIDKSIFYLAHPDAAEKLRCSAYARARADHTWVRRFQKLFSNLKLGMQTRSVGIPATV